MYVHSIDRFRTITNLFIDNGVSDDRYSDATWESMSAIERGRCNVNHSIIPQGRRIILRDCA